MRGIGSKIQDSSLIDKKYGMIPTLVGFDHAGAAFVHGFSGETGESEFELESGKADRRVMIFVYPRDKEPTSLDLMVLSKEKKPILWVSSPIKNLPKVE